MCTDYEKLQAKMSATVLSHPGDITKTSLFSWTKYDIADSLFLGLLTWIKPTKHRCIFAGLPLNVVPFLTRSKGLAVGGAELNAEPAYQSKPYAGVMVALCFFFISSFSAPVDLIKHSHLPYKPLEVLCIEAALYTFLICCCKFDFMCIRWIFLQANVIIFISFSYFSDLNLSLLCLVTPVLGYQNAHSYSAPFLFNIQDYCLYFKL